jgi:hypothetical protein
MLLDQRCFWSEKSASGLGGQVPLQTSAEFVRTYDPQLHEIVDAIAAVVIGAQAGLNWLRTDPPDLEEMRLALNDIAGNGRRAAERIIQLRALMKNVPTANVNS